MNSMTQIDTNINFGALLTFEQVQQYETDQVGMMRRLTLASLTRSFDELLQPALESEASAETFLEMMNCSSNCVEYLKDLLQLAEQAQTRLYMVGQAYLNKQEPHK